VAVRARFAGTPVGLRLGLGPASDHIGTIELVNGGNVCASLPVIKASAEHRSFILSTWVRSYAGTARKFMKREAHLKGDAPIAERLWDQSVVVSSDGFAIQAWMCGIGCVLHHCYVIPELRRNGIMSALTRNLLGDTVEVSRPWPYQLPVRWTYNPFRIGG
jgi:hypothetical protein